MIEPDIPSDEPYRLDALTRLNLLDTPSEERFDRLTRMARQLFKVNIALVSLVDGHRQWFKSKQGLDVPETPRSISFSGHAILSDQTLVVSDATTDPRFRDNPLVLGSPGIRFYAGAPLHTPDGYRIGTLCLIHNTPRTVDREELATLRDLADTVESEIFQRRALEDLSRFRETLDSTEDMIFIFDPETLEFDYVNRGGIRSLGYSRNELLGGMHPYDIKPLLPEPDFRHLIAPLLRGEQSTLTFETLHRHRDGSDFPVEIVMQMFRPESDPHSHPGKLIAIVRDLRERKKAEYRLKAEKEKLQITLSSIGDAVITTDHQGLITYMNPVAADLTGWSLSEATGRPLTDVFRIINEHSRLPVENPVQKVLEHGVIVGLANHTLLIDLHGNERPVADSAAPIRMDPEGEILGTVLVFRDQTDERENLCLLSDKEQTLRTILDHAPIGIWMSDASGKLIFVNRTFSDSFGVPEQTLFEAAYYADPIDPEFAEKNRASDMIALQSDLPHLSREKVRFSDGQFHTLEILKARIQSTPPRLIGISRDMTDILKQEELLRHMAHYDSLTNLYNRNALSERFSDARIRADTRGDFLGVCYLDLDHFKPINDLFGHDAGDRVLMEMGRRLKQGVREEDTLARLGGDEFVLLLASPRDEKEFVTAIERIQKLVSESLLIGNEAIRVSCSIGATLYPRDSRDFDTLLRYADLAMYQAKQLGRNRYQIYHPDIDTQTRDRIRPIEHLRQALRNGEFELQYQPKVNMRTGFVHGLEALIRWNHPQRGRLLPAEFLPLAEESDLILEIDQWVIEESFCQIERWQQQGLAGCETCRISLNITSRNLMLPEFVQSLKDTFSRHPLVSPQHIEIEILESSAIRDLQTVSNTMAECASFGITFAIDDFGTGYSSLSYLKALPVQRLKIDKSFGSVSKERPAREN